MTPPLVILLHDDDLSGSLDPDKANAHELRVVGPFDSELDAWDWVNNTGDLAVTWLCQLHEVKPPTEVTA